MHSTSIWPSHRERCGGLPRMSVAALAATRSYSYPSYSYPSYSPPQSAGGGGSGGGGSGGSVRPRWSRAGSTLYTRLPRCGHSRRSATPSRSERPCLTFGTSFSATRGTTGGGRQGATRSARVARCQGLVQREGCCSRHAVAPRNRQGLGEVASRDRAGDPCIPAPRSRRGHRRQRAFGTPRA